VNNTGIKKDIIMK